MIYSKKSFKKRNKKLAPKSSIYPYSVYPTFINQSINPDNIKEKKHGSVIFRVQKRSSREKHKGERLEARNHAFQDFDLVIHKFLARNC